MRNFTNLFLSLGLTLSLSACGNPADDSNTQVTTDDTSACQDGAKCVDDTGDPPQGSASVMLDVYQLADIISLPITLTGQDVFTLTSHEAAEVPAPDDYVASVGDDSLSGQFGFPVYLDENGLYWAATPLDLGTVADGSTVADSLDLFELFEPGQYSCTHSWWDYSADAPDHKGTQRGKDVALQDQQISVDQDGIVQAEHGSTSLDVTNDNGDDVYVVGNGLAIQDDNGYAIVLNSSLSPDGFWLSVENSAVPIVDDITCQL